MPKRNAIKVYGEDQFYHCYNRGAGKSLIFRDDEDYGYFLSLFKRHLSKNPVKDKTRREYPHYVDQVEVVAYCLMPNHFHLMLYLKEKQGIEHLMRSVMTAYSRYYNLRYKRSGTLFEGSFLASRITSEEYLQHVSRYIHLNPVDINKNPLSYSYSSLSYFSSKKHAEWIHPERILGEGEADSYVKSLKDGEEYHVLRNLLKHELAK